MTPAIGDRLRSIVRFVVGTADVTLDAVNRLDTLASEALSHQHTN